MSIFTILLPRTLLILGVFTIIILLVFAYYAINCYYSSMTVVREMSKKFKEKNKFTHGYYYWEKPEREFTLEWTGGNFSVKSIVERDKVTATVFDGE